MCSPYNWDSSNVILKIRLNWLGLGLGQCAMGVNHRVIWIDRISFDNDSSVLQGLWNRRLKIMNQRTVHYQKIMKKKTSFLDIGETTRVDGGKRTESERLAGGATDLWLRMVTQYTSILDGSCVTFPYWLLRVPILIIIDIHTSSSSSSRKYGHKE